MSSLDEIIRLCLVNHQALMVTLGGLAPMLLLGFAFGVYERLRELQGRNIGNGVFLAYYINICLVGVVGMCYTYEWVPDDLWSVLALMPRYRPVGGPAKRRRQHEPFA